MEIERLEAQLRNAALVCLQRQYRAQRAQISRPAAERVLCAFREQKGVRCIRIFALPGRRKERAPALETVPKARPKSRCEKITWCQGMNRCSIHPLWISLSCSGKFSVSGCVAPPAAIRLAHEPRLPKSISTFGRPRNWHSDPSSGCAIRARAASH